MMYRAPLPVDSQELFAGEFIDINRFTQQLELYRFSPDPEGVTVAQRKAGSHTTAHPAGCRYKIQFNTLKIQRSFGNRPFTVRWPIYRGGAEDKFRVLMPAGTGTDTRFAVGAVQIGRFKLNDNFTPRLLQSGKPGVVKFKCPAHQRSLPPKRGWNSYETEYTAVSTILVLLPAISRCP